MTYTIITQTIPTISSEPEEHDESYSSYAEALFGVLGLASTETGFSLEPVDSFNCLSMHRLGARQAWRTSKDGESSFIAIVGG